MIIHLDARTLRQIADQLDAYTQLEANGADHQKPNTVISINGTKIAYLYWHQDDESYMAEFIRFPPGDAELLYYHDESMRTGGVR